MYQAIVFLPLLGAILAGADRARRRARAFSRRGTAAGRGRGCGRSRAASRRAMPRTARPVITATMRTAAHEPAAAGSRTAELITTTLLMISMILSWIAFVQVGFGASRRAGAGFHLDRLRRSEGRLVAAHRHADRGDAGGGEHDLGLRAPLFHRLHGRGPVPAALLRLSVDLHLLHADAGDGGQSGPAVLRLGRRRVSRAIC